MPLPTQSLGDLITATIWNAVIAFVNAIEAGTKVLTKVTLDGAASDPAVSPAGDAVMAYNTSEGELRVSLNGGPYERLGSKHAYADPLLVGGSLFGFRN